MIKQGKFKLEKWLQLIWDQSSK